MKTYRIADMSNGPFGDVYASLEEAEAALEECIAEGDALNALNEETDQRARDFFCIVDAKGEEI